MLAMILPILATISCGRATVQISVLDPLMNLPQGAAVPVSTSYRAEVARKEYAEWEVVIAAGENLDNIHVVTSSLKKQDGTELPAPRIRAEGYVPVDRGVDHPAHDRIATPPANLPDPLLEDVPTKLAADSNLPLWVDLEIPASAKSGDYEGTVTVSGDSGGTHFSVPNTLRLHVYAVTLGPSRLWVTQWFMTWTGYMPGSNKPGSKEEDAYLALMAKKMAEHRQNVLMIDPFLAKISWDANGKVLADFSRFDDWVRIFKDAGVIGRIEGAHFGTRLGTGDTWRNQFGLRVPELRAGKLVWNVYPTASPEADKFYSQFLPLLVQHLKDKGWWGIYMQHLADEPIDENANTYNEGIALMRKYAPGMKFTELTHTTKIAGFTDVWTPILELLDQDFAFYKGRQQMGEELWTYTCRLPEGEYANRFIELPLIKTRLIHWINYRFGITGYNHWAFNRWTSVDPFQDVTRTKAKDGKWNNFLPAGDSYIVYPKNGKLLDSIRYEAERDGIDDYELLSMLADKDPATAQTIAQQVVYTFSSYNTNLDSFRQIRRRLLTSLQP